MAGSKLPVVVSHGEGRAEFAVGQNGKTLVAMRYIDNRGAVATSYPFNPNGSTLGIAWLTTPDGRFTGGMPHTERTNYLDQWFWRPQSWKTMEANPWHRPFQNQYEWCRQS